MRRPIVGIGFAYILGIIVQHIFCMTCIFVSMMIFTMVFVGVFILRKDIKIVFLIVCIFMMGILNYEVSNNDRGKIFVFKNESVELVGEVINDLGNSKLIVETENVLMNNKKYKMNEKILVKFNKEFIKSENIVGRKIKVHGIIKMPQTRRNPNMFDYEKYLKTKKIYSILYSDMKKPMIIGDGKHVLLRSSHNIKKNIQRNILRILPQKEGTLLCSIFFGDKESIDEDLYLLFRQVGIAHVLAVSGLHVGIVYMFLNKMLKRQRQIIKNVIILIVLYIYVMTTGYAVSIVRATLMVAICNLATFVNRRYDSLSCISVLVLYFLIVNPMVLLDIGFQLSFTAVLFIILFYKMILEKLYKLPECLAQLVAITISAQMGIIPIVAYHYNQISGISFMINIPIVLIVGYIVPVAMIMIILCTIYFKLGFLVSPIVLVGLKAMIGISYVAKRIPFSSMEVVSPNLFLIACYYIIVGILAVKNRDEDFKNYFNKKIVIGIIVFSYLLFAVMSNVFFHCMKITFIDVGQGDCILIETPRGKNILIDGGPVDKKRGKTKIYKEKLVTYLLKNRIRSIDLIILSHVHDDHIGGLVEVAKKWKLGAIMIGTEEYPSKELDEILSICIKNNTNIYKVKKGDHIKIEKDVSIDILHPKKKLLYKTQDDLNNNSLVCTMKYKNQKILFTGDIEIEGEQQIIDLCENIDILKVPHHGSGGASTKTFLKCINPKVAVIQVGKNTFGHPSKETLSRYKQIGSTVFRNDLQGAVIVTLDGEKIYVRTMIKD
ncbi:DNA internalization-related competence protein ComEC/Rec2 [Lutibacter sp. B2]|nr:DNA internalization-related competence protein ComEC/Rec2 [Lutibacter sp. B2]